MQSISILSIKSSSFHGQQKPYLAALYMYLEIFWKQFTGDRSVSNATNTSLHHSLKEYVKNGEGGRQVEERCRQAWGSGCRAEDKPHCKKNHDNKKRERTLGRRGGKCHFLYSVPENLSVQFSCMLYYTDLSISPRAGLHRRNPLGPCQCTPQSLPSAKHNTFHIG